MWVRHQTTGCLSEGRGVKCSYLTALPCFFNTHPEAWTEEMSKQRWNVVICGNLNDPRRHYATWMNQTERDKHLINITHIKYYSLDLECSPKPNELKGLSPADVWLIGSWAYWVEVGHWGVSLKYIRALGSNFSPSFPSWPWQGEQACFTTHCLPHHRPRNHGVCCPWADSSETRSWKDSFLLKLIQLKGFAIW